MKYGKARVMNVMLTNHVPPEKWRKWAKGRKDHSPEMVDFLTKRGLLAPEGKPKVKFEDVRDAASQ